MLARKLGLAGEIFAVAMGSALLVSSAQAENLHRRYGAYWNCGYIVVGQPYYETCKSCEARGMEFFKQGNSGYCVPKVQGPSVGTPDVRTPRPSVNVNRPDSVRPPSFSAPSVRTPSPTVRLTKWGAVAAGIDSNRVGAGAAWNYGTKVEAEQAALRRCFERASSCKVVSTFSAGCGYITTGSSGGRLGWGAGPSAQAAYNNCSSRGLQCSQPTGGCID